MGAVTGRTDLQGYDYINFSLASCETAGTATYRAHWEAPAACKVYEVSITAGAAFTGANTNTRHINIIAPTGTEIASRDLVSGTDMAANTSYATYSSATGVALTAGQHLIVENELIGTGLALIGGISVRAKISWT